MGREVTPHTKSSFWPAVWANGQVLYPLILAAGIVGLSGESSPPTPGFIPSFDKLAHFCVFGLLATLLFRLLPPASRSAWTAFLVILAVSLFGLSDEIHQSFTPGRSVEFADWVADTLGATVAVLVYWKWEPYRGLLEFRRGRKPD